MALVEKKWVGLGGWRREAIADFSHWRQAAELPI